MQLTTLHLLRMERRGKETSPALEKGHLRPNPGDDAREEKGQILPKAPPIPRLGGSPTLIPAGKRFAKPPPLPTHLRIAGAAVQRRLRAPSRSPPPLCPSPGTEVDPGEGH